MSAPAPRPPVLVLGVPLTEPELKLYDYIQLAKTIRNTDAELKRKTEEMGPSEAELERLRREAEAERQRFGSHLSADPIRVDAADAELRVMEVKVRSLRAEIHATDLRVKDLRKREAGDKARLVHEFNGPVGWHQAVTNLLVRMREDGDLKRKPKRPRHEQ